ncbi:hypothetical protein [Sorangium sp. So ce1000]|uniref:hypothetical protein n=1 Tax=Sorangium sp. So ce1000 TaxID=3133325 RepID=UPI003F5E6B4B
MPNAIEATVDRYLRAWNERDPAEREKLIESCFAADGRLVTRRRVVRGRAALAVEMARVSADPRLRCVRRLSAIDTGDATFRVRGVAEFHDGTSAESFDAGEVDAAGKIALVLTFDGPLADASEEAAR